MVVKPFILKLVFLARILISKSKSRNSKMAYAFFVLFFALLFGNKRSSYVLIMD